MDAAAWVIQKPSVGRYRPDVLRMEPRPLPPMAQGQLLLRTLVLSLDPSNLVWLKLLPGWMEDVRVGDVMKGPSLAVVEQSRDPAFAPGDLVFGALDWGERSVVPAASVLPLDPVPGEPLENHLSIYSHVGLAALIGISVLGKPRAGQTVLVSGAAGATGSLACQIARDAGARVVGIAGGSRKRDYLLHELGLDAAIDYRSESLGPALAAHCPAGVDVFFDNVGGETLDTTLLHLAIHARVVICGAISQYSSAGPNEGYQLANIFQLLMKRASMRGFVVPDFADRQSQLLATLRDMVRRGTLRARAHVLDGLEHAAPGLERLLTGEHEGKLLVRVSAL